MTEAEIADARAMAWLSTRGWTINQIVGFSGYSGERVSRLVTIGMHLRTIGA